MTRIHRALAALALAASACHDKGADPTTVAAAYDDALTDPAIGDALAALRAEPPPTDPVDIGLVFHLESWSDGDGHASALVDVADLLASYGASASYEAGDGLRHLHDALNASDSASRHASVCGGAVDDCTEADLQAALERAHEELSATGLLADGVAGISGHCGAGPWIEATRSAGFAYVTSPVEWCLLSLDAEHAAETGVSITGGSAADHHSPYPSTPVGRARTWWVSSSETWIDSDPSGTVLVIPTGTLRDLDPSSRGLGVDDLAQYFEDLGHVIAEARGTTEPLHMVVVWSFGEQIVNDPETQGRFEAWLELLAGLQDDDYVEWVNTDQIYDTATR